ncbi:MAG: hypothetical protein ACRDSK_21585 [Actinophytocola sp.]|uniref:hypothetical protein n=1 Tax=Actinophytocola sp. TaxID=1872138 RepID=UPI003D6BA969
MTQPSMRPPYPPPHPQVLPRYVPPPRRPIAGIVAGLCGLVAAGLALGGSFAPIYEVDREVGDLVIEWWGTGPSADTVAGLALVLAALLLASGAALAFARVVTGARLLLALGLGSLTGTVLLALLNTLEALERWNGEFLGPGESLTFTTSTGLWLPLAGVVVGVVAVVFAHRPQVRVEPMTPRIGFPMPYTRGVAVGQLRPPGPPPVIPAPGAPAPSTSDEEGEITLRTKVTESAAEEPASEPVSEAPTEVSDPEAPTEAPVTMPVAHDAPTEIPPSAEQAPTIDEPETVADSPAPEDWTTRLEEQPAEPEQPPAPEQAAAEAPAEPEPTQPEQAPASEQPPTPEQATTEQPEPAQPEEPPAPEPGKSSLGDLPAAPPAPELADDQDDKKN